MKTKKTMANHSFEMLADSSDFLNIVLNNITSCILMLDKEMKLQAFNNVMKTIFSNRESEDLLYMRCGEAIGCAHQIEEAKDCGSTSRCSSCDLRLAAFDSYLNNNIIYKQDIVRPFFNKAGEVENKKLQFSTRHFYFQKEKYIIMIINDTSDFDIPKQEVRNIQYY